MAPHIVDVKHVRSFLIYYLAHIYDKEKDEHIETAFTAFADMFEIANNVYKIVFGFEDDFMRETYAVANSVDKIDSNFIKQLAEKVCYEHNKCLDIISITYPTLKGESS